MTITPGAPQPDGADNLLAIASTLTRLAKLPPIERIKPLGELLGSTSDGVGKRMRYARHLAAVEAVRRAGSQKAVADRIGISEVGISLLVRTPEGRQAR